MRTPVGCTVHAFAMVPAQGEGRPQLTTLEVPASAEAWRRCGFDVPEDSVFAAGPVAVRLDAAAQQVTLRLSEPVEGLAFCEQADAPLSIHPNGVTAVDHVVLATSRPEAAVAALVAAGAEVRGTRETELGGTRIEQRFLPLPGGMIELVSSGDWPESPAIWGITFACSDPDAAAAAYPDLIPAPHDAVQPGRRITTIAREASLGTRVALISPR